MDARQELHVAELFRGGLLLHYPVRHRRFSGKGGKVRGALAELKIYVSDSLNEKFRRAAMSIYGYGRGSISKAAEVALTKWCAEHEAPEPAKTTDHPDER